jgi:DNA repair protein RadC
MAVREILLSYGADLGKSNGSVRTNLRTPAAAAVLMAPLLEKEVCEVGYVLCLTAKMDLIGYHQVSRGTVNATPMYAREVFKAAVLTNAAGIIVVHNHPSGRGSQTGVPVFWV